MPYFCSTATPIYSELLDKVHGLIDSAGSPVMLIGNMNATLPQTSQLSQNWYKARPFTSHRVLLYDLLCNNSLMSANFAYEQSVDDTYFKGHARSYIDHVFVSEEIRPYITSCSILALHEDNTNGHLSILTKMIIKTQTETLALVDVYKCFKINYIDWKSIGYREKYCGALQRSLHNLNTDHTHVTTPEDGQAFVNQLYDAIE